MTPHNSAVNHVLVYASQKDCLVTPRQVGMFYPEHEIKAERAAWVKLTGGIRLEQAQLAKPRMIGKRGEADISGIMPTGRGIAWELKTGDATLKKHQKLWGESWTKHNGIYLPTRFDREDWKFNTDVALGLK